MRELTAEEQEIIRHGQLAEAALSNPAIANCVNELSEQLANAMLGTAPQETALREKFYFLHSALRELAALLNHRVALKAQIEASLADEENDTNV